MSSRSIDRNYSYLGYVNSLTIHTSDSKLHKYTPQNPQKRESEWVRESEKIGVRGIVIVGSLSGPSQLWLQYLSFTNYSICIQCLVSFPGLSRGVYKGKILCRNLSFIYLKANLYLFWQIRRKLSPPLSHLAILKRQIKILENRHLRVLNPDKNPSKKMASWLKK